MCQVHIMSHHSNYMGQKEIRKRNIPKSDQGGWCKFVAGYVEHPVISTRRLEH